MRAMGRHIWLVSTVLLASAGTALSRPPPPSVFDAPPYSTVVEGMPCGNKKVPSVVPAMAAGEARFFSFYCGAIHAGTCDRETRVAVDMAREILRPAIDSRRTLVQCAVEAITLRLFRKSGRVAVARDVVAITKHGDKGTVHTMGDSVSLSVMARTTTISAAVSAGRLTADRSAGSTPLIAAADSSGVDRADRSGEFGAVDDARSVAMLVDSDFVKMLIDANLIDGFYDAKNILMAPATEVPPEELAAFQSLLEKGGPLSNLVNRAFSAAFREGDAGEATNCPVELSMQAVGRQPFNHGARVLFTVSLANRGKRTVYDAVILNAVPDHTAFSEFPLRDAPRRGFSQTYLPKRKLLAWKLYRPLQPGETFRASCLLALDPWRIPADWRPPKKKR